MSHVALVNRSQLFAAATAITALGLFTLSPPAHARPTVPLAPACSQWGFPGAFSLKQSTGDTVRFNSTGPVAGGRAHATGGINGAFDGPVTGGIQGDKLDFIIQWEIIYSNQSRPSQGHYTSLVGNDGFAHGDTHDESGGASGHWDSTVPLVCTTPAAPPPAAAPPPNPRLSEPATEVPNRRVVPPAAPPGAPMATVRSDVDIYDAPGGKGKKIGILRSGRQVQLVRSCKPNDWCDVVIPELPAGNGWVWDQFLQF
ncbi:MAG: hypothetical protein ACXVX7_07765 [Mycobacterium sp.]